MMVRFVVLLLLACWGTGVNARQMTCSAPMDTVLSPVNIVDVEHGTIRQNRALVLSGGRIALETDADEINVQTPLTIKWIDGKGAYIIPGLWDMHVHTLWDKDVPEPFFQMFLKSGVTAVRDMGGSLEIAAATHARINACEISAPHLWYPGPFLDGPQPVDPSLSIALSNAEEARAAVRMLKQAGVDFLKVYTMTPKAVFEAILEEALLQNLPVAGHLPASAGANDPAILRMASIEHQSIELGGYCAANDQAACAYVFDALITAKVAQTPTLVVREISTAMRKSDFEEPEFMEAMPAIIQSYWRADRTSAMARTNNEWRAKRAISLSHAKWMARELARQGAIILAGSDAGTPFIVPGESLHQELALLVEAGLSEAEALRAATLSPARFMKQTDMGVIVPGAIADFIILEANPLDDIHNTRTILDVYSGGIAVNRNGH